MSDFKKSNPHDIDVTIRIRVFDHRLEAAGLTAEQFAQNMILFEHGFDIPSVVLSQLETEDDPIEGWLATILKTEIVKELMTNEETKNHAWSIAES